jgi:tRNA(fMet)-specific endonuclease VapC
VVKYCIDTNILIEYLKGNVTIVKKLKDLFELTDVFVTSISLCELYKGVFLSSKKDKELPILEEFVNSMGLLSLDNNSSKLFGEIYSKLKIKGKLVPEFDLIIASIVKANDLILITMDKKHFSEIIGLKVDVW